MSELTTIARPYAKAAFDFAVEQSAVEKWAEMLKFSSELIKDETMQTFLNSSFSSNKLADTVISICGDQLDQYGQNLIRLMAENKRLIVLPAVYQEFQHYVEEHQKIVEVQVISAQPLSVAQSEKIVAAMEKRLARKVKLNCSLDSSLIAGVIIRTDDFVIDGSSRGQLARLANELQL
ncbi:F0F1 ATP synthase subunit delta [Pasteurella canis]|uniref:F0F1 ATP synthase subunit delta n=1 Tax=Pasteurella canis TaxID=753 RepID=UPI001CC1BE32|nr:F0F1 ATP synthase subunit delta [Pasteurella canis]UAX41842.1 F0F1 ATP synthase subunit delta [Pasteurella canis]